MTQLRNRRFSSAHVMAALALFISLGGTSYAVATLPKNSVGSAQVKNGSLTANDLAKGVVTAGPQGSSGARGPRGAEGAAGPIGPVGPVGPAGAGQPVPLVATLPVSPTDGQDVYFQSASMASSGVVWHLRYRSNATGPYKWEFVGGAGLHAVAGAATTTATSYLAGPVGPAITVPLAGEYDADLTARLYSSSNSAPAAALAVLGDGSGEFPNARIDHYQGSPATLGVTLVAATNTRLARITRGTPGVVDVRLFGNTGEVHSDFRELRIRPVRVG